MLTLSTQIDAMGRLGRALADPTRCRMLLMLAEGPRFPGEMAGELGLTRSNVSNHLACLRDCGIVVANPMGRRLRYELADPAIADVLTTIFALELAPRGACRDFACSHDGCCVNG